MSTYDPGKIEQKWQRDWKKKKLYRFNPTQKPVYSIDNPPRYASGTLHIGHAVHYTHIDFVARYKRMTGYNVFFPLCFDVNGIPIEERVEKKYGITRKDIDRHEFIKLCEEFAQQHIQEMTTQFYRLGESMDDSIYYQTNETYYRRLTQLSFLELYDQNLIYRGKFPVNWCPRCMTAMADAEIEYKPRSTKLNTLKFYFTPDSSSSMETIPGVHKDTHGYYLEIATTRPELLATCQLVAVHPQDERANMLIGKTLAVPLFEKKVDIVADDAVDPSFGTGIVMICTIGDKVDLEWAFKYDLPLDICIDEEGKMTHLAGKYQGLSILDARTHILQDLEEKKYLTQQEPLDQSIGVCWRCKTPVEFIQTEQYFLKLLPFKQDVLDASDNMAWFPDFMKLRLRDWVQSLKWDWVISRQRYFATPIPLWECSKCREIVVARPDQCYIDPTLDDPPVSSCPKCGGKLVGCTDVFDTWMDSSISPLYNTFWHRDDTLFSSLYPMSLRPQAHDIIRTWAFYTILRCTLLTGTPPFKEVMMGGFILSPDGTPMHTSVGNVIDPLEILEEHGSDALRYYAAVCTLGEDNPFRYKDLVRGQRLMKKLWNIEKFIGNTLQKKPDKSTLQPIDTWIFSLYNELVEDCTRDMEEFKYSSALRKIEYFLWHEFADHYLEMIKQRVYEESDPGVQYVLYTLGLGIIKMLAPFLPHITEEIYMQYYHDYEKDESIHVSHWPVSLDVDKTGMDVGVMIKDIISEIRGWKSNQGIALNAPLGKFTISGSSALKLKQYTDVIKSTLNLEEVDIQEKPPSLQEQVSVSPDFSRIGKKFQSYTPVVIKEIKAYEKQIVQELDEKGTYHLTTLHSLGFSKNPVLEKDDVKIERTLKTQKGNIDVIKYKDVFISMEK